MSGPEHGLSGTEAARRFVECGPNEPAPVRRLSSLLQLLHLFANPLVIILLIASAICGSLGQAVDALIIVTMVYWASPSTSGNPTVHSRRQSAFARRLSRRRPWSATARGSKSLSARRARRRLPACGRRPRARRRAAAGVAGSLRPASGVNRRVAARRQARLAFRREQRAWSGRSASRVSRHLSGQRDGDGRGDRHRAEDDVRRHRRAAREPVRRKPSSSMALRRFGLLILRTTVVLVLFIRVGGHRASCATRSSRCCSRWPWPSA